MKFFSNVILGMSVACFVAATTLPGCKSHKTETAITQEQMDDPNYIPQLFPRTGELAKSPDWLRTQAKVKELTDKIATKPNDVHSRLQIATIYISEARITGNADYYQSIFKILDDVKTLDPKNFEATVFKASVKMSQHQFADAKKLAQEAMGLNPDNAYVYGVMVDADVELGNYTEAVQMSDKMESLKPSLEAYSRASYLREIYGDYPGAIKAMQMAVDAGQPGLESDEWARVALGDLYLSTGKLDTAVSEYKSALSFRAEYPQAEIGLAKVERARKNYPAAIEHTKTAIKMVSETAFVSLLADLYELNGDKQKAADTRQQVVDLLVKAEDEQPKDPSVRHNPNRELATAYMNNKEYDKALEYAKKDLAMRPENIDANELMAWIYYQKGDFANAKTYAANTLKTHTKNASTLYKAGLIYTKAGDAAMGTSLEQQAMAVTPYIDPTIMLAAK